MGREKEAETRLIKALRDKGAYAVHMDCTIDGFPDIFVSHNGNISLVEMKEGPMKRKLSKAFEKSQPVFYMLCDYQDTYVCLFDGERFHLFYASSVVEAMGMDSEAQFNDLELSHVCIGSSVDIARSICDRSF
jgi:hypothetical protein